METNTVGDIAGKSEATNRNKPKRRVALIFIAVLMCLAICIQYYASSLVKRFVGVSCPHGMHPATYATIDQVSPVMQDATVAMEDGHFYTHHGFDFPTIWHALLVDIQDGKIELGGSTITQQLAKSLFLTKDRTIWPKLMEIPLTIELERQLPKKRILELYLNCIDYGSGQTGITAAAGYYFHTTPDKLSLVDSACLVGIVPAPDQIPGQMGLVMECEQTALSRMVYFFPNRYSDQQMQSALAQPLDRLMAPFRDAYDRGAVETIPATWHGVGMFFFALPDTPLKIPNVNVVLKPQLAAFLDDAHEHYGLVGIDHLGVYNDRPTRQNANIISAHAYGRAIDISGFRFKDSEHYAVVDHDKPNVAPHLALMETLLKRHFDIVVDWRDDPERHQTHFHCEARAKM